MCIFLIFFYILDPLSMSPQKALETIGANLQKQYENWQPRVRPVLPAVTLCITNTVLYMYILGMH